MNLIFFCSSFTKAGISELISRDSFCGPEEKIFECVCEWVRHNEELHPKAADVLRGVRLPLMNIDTLLETVRPTGLVSPELILDAISTQNKSRSTELHYRGYLGKFYNLDCLIFKFHCAALLHFQESTGKLQVNGHRLWHMISHVFM